MNFRLTNPGINSNPASMPSHGGSYATDCCNMKSAAPAQECREVESSMNRLNGSIEILLNRLSSLRDRLDPVLSPPRPTACGSDNDCAPQSPLASAIRGKAELIGSAAETVSELLSRLEV
jgi:hypothetical protein